MTLASDLAGKVEGLQAWDLAGVAEEAQVAEVTIFAARPALTDEFLRQTPAGRLATIAQQLRAGLDTVLATGKLSNWKLLKDTDRRKGRYYGVRGEIKLLDLSAIAQLAAVDRIQIEKTNGKKHRRPQAAKKKLGYYCVKMTVAIQIEGCRQGLQTWEERYVLYRAFSETEAATKAKEAASDYEKPYLNSEGLLVRWKVESVDDVYEVVQENAKDLDGAEVFSKLHGRRLTAERTWL
jgi:hypothetical protein